MNHKGIFCFLLLLAFFALETRFLAEAGNATKQLQKASEIAFEAEKASFARALMENSADSVVEESLRQGLLLNLEPEQVKESVNRNLAELFKKTESAYNEGIAAKFCPLCLNESYLNENSAVFVAKTGRKAVEAQYCFTAGVHKDKKIEAEISGKNIKALFAIPQGYCIKALVVE